MKNRKTSSVAIACASAAVVGLGLAACGGGHSAPDAPALVTKSCADLSTMTIPAASIGLPTTGVTVTSSTVVTATGTGATAVGEYCKVLASIKPVDPTAPNIKFQVN